MTNRHMAEFGRGLRDSERNAMAELVTGNSFGRMVDRSATAMTNRCNAPMSLEGALGEPRWNGWTPDSTRSHRYVNVIID